MYRLFNLLILFTIMLAGCTSEDDWEVWNGEKIDGNTPQKGLNRDVRKFRGEEDLDDYRCFRVNDKDLEKWVREDVTFGGPMDRYIRVYLDDTPPLYFNTSYCASSMDLTPLDFESCCDVHFDISASGTSIALTDITKDFYPNRKGDYWEFTGITVGSDTYKTDLKVIDINNPHLIAQYLSILEEDGTNFKFEIKPNVLHERRHIFLRFQSKDPVDNVSAQVFSFYDKRAISLHQLARGE